jgi:DNA polymerase (family 10)
MINQELAKIFFAIADLLEAADVAFKPFAYRRAALTLQDFEVDAAEIYKEGGLKTLQDIPGVGVSIAEKIEEYLKTGRIAYYDRLKKKLPVDLEELITVEGLGPKRAKILYKKLGIASLKELENAAKKHQIARLAGFGEKSEKNILQGIEFQKHDRGRFLLGEILPAARAAKKKLEALPEIARVDIAGSLRRGRETIGDVDLLAIISPKSGPAAVGRVMDFFVHLDGVQKVWGRGDTKASVRMAEGFDMDLRLLPAASYGAALQYFTGSKEHNVALRQIAKSKGFKLSEYGLFYGRKIVAGKNEREIYEKMGLQWVPPELREDSGEIDAARANKLPRLVGYGDLKGDLHCHSDWDGGDNSIEQIAAAAMAMGYEYVGIADHTKMLKIENGLDEKRLAQRNLEIDKLNLSFKKEGRHFTILKGCEANILNDGSIDIDDKTLAQLDFVIAGIHSNFKMAKDQMTRRIVHAMENPNVDIISHPTGRLIKKRDEYQIDMEKIFNAAKKIGTVLEINSYPQRLDLNDRNIRLAKEYGIKMVINTDSHIIGQMRFAEFGISQARRGWATASDIINTRPLNGLLKCFKK